MRYETTSESQISNVVHIQGNVDAKIGYDAPCILIPIFVCEYQETSSKNVSTTSSGESFGIWINHNTSWLAPYTKLYTLSGGNYDGYTVYGVTSAYTQELTDWNFNGPQIFGYKSVGPIAGSTCGCTSISEGNYISALVVLQSVH